MSRKPEGIPDGLILVGVVARTHGLRGEVLVNLETDFPDERFRPGAQLTARVGAGALESLTVGSVRFHQGRPLLTFEGCESIDDVERFAGAALYVPETELRPLPPGTYYHHHLVGCEVVTADGVAVGTVSAVEGDMGASRLVVRSRRSEVLIPFADAICAVDLGARRIVVTPPEGLLEVNGDWREEGQ